MTVRKPDDPGAEKPATTLAGVGPQGAPTLRDTVDDGDTGPGRPRGPSAQGAATRYQLGEVIGRGGMGEVVSARDEQIGRSVAIKRMRSATPSADDVGRFLREVRIQGRLEHPAVVPVHELWYDDAGQPFFVMKQLAGTTVASVVERLAKHDLGAMARFSRQRLLRAFADVCLAIEFAHTRGVVHRDLKPANIMLGDFGEVYVLDWGVARILAVPGAEGFADIDAIDGGDVARTSTRIGTLLGTPGYIAPEQIAGDPGIDARADIYALGCILFEMLALEPLHPRDGNEIASTLTGADARPSARSPRFAIPPELDAICVRATEIERAGRFATARELGDAVQRYLDGDRDVALRRTLASAELEVARSRLTSADNKQRGDALRAASRALALDPTAREAAELVARLMLEPPPTAPAEVAHEMHEADLTAFRASGRFGVIVAIAYLAFSPLLYWIGFRDTWYIVGGAVISAFIIAVCTFLTPRKPFFAGYLTIGANLAMIGLYAWLTTPVVLGPGPAVILVMLMAQHRIFTRAIWLAVVGLAATLGPWLLGALGVMPMPVDITGSDITLHTAAGSLDPVATVVGLLVYVVAMVLLAALLAKLQDDERRASRRALQLHTWQLRQLVPT